LDNELGTREEIMSLITTTAGYQPRHTTGTTHTSPAGRSGVLGFSPAPGDISQQEIVRKELILIGSRLNCRFIPQSSSSSHSAG
jgi:L-gulonate 5-dehydrogenase